jgi:hypothetical protein
VAILTPAASAAADALPATAPVTAPLVTWRPIRAATNANAFSKKSSGELTTDIISTS